MPAAEIMNVVADQTCCMLRTPEVIVATWRSARPEIDGLSESQVREALEGLDPLWEELFPAEQTRVIQLLVDRIDVGVAGLKVRLRVQGLAHMVQDLAGIAAAPRSRHNLDIDMVELGIAVRMPGTLFSLAVRLTGEPEFAQ